MMQYHQPTPIVSAGDHPTTWDLQKRMRFLSGARETLLPETSRKSKKGCSRAGQRRGVQQNQRHYSTGASERFLAETKLCHREEENAECHDDTSGRKQQRYLRKKHARHSREYHLQWSPREAIHTSWGSPYMQRGPVSRFWVHRKHSRI